MFLRQLFDSRSSTYTYLLADPATRKAALIDPVDDQVERDIKLLEELDLTLEYALDTHVHADHVTASGMLRERLGCRTVGGTQGAACADVRLAGGEVLEVGSLRIEVLATPGHTDDSLSFRVGDNVFTGDALLVRGTGRTDFQNGDAGQLYDTLTGVLFALPENTTVWPAHDYRGHTRSTIGEEKRHNPRVAGKSREQFIRIMDELQLPRPKLIDEAVPKNRLCGQPEVAELSAEVGAMAAPASVRSVWQRAREENGYRDVAVDEAATMQGAIRVVDVREASEFDGELGHIPGALHVPLGTLGDRSREWNPQQPLLLVCRTGRRSVAAAQQLKERGFGWLFNLDGGMVAWREADLPVAR